jgi:hypothetical protein
MKQEKGWYWCSILALCCTQFLMAMESDNSCTATQIESFSMQQETEVNEQVMILITKKKIAEIVKLYQRQQCATQYKIRDFLIRQGFIDELIRDGCQTGVNSHLIQIKIIFDKSNCDKKEDMTLDPFSIAAKLRIMGAINHIGKNN